MDDFVRRDMRLAGRVQRYHTWPHIKEQSVGEHSWQLLRILMAVWPDVPDYVMKYVVLHDVGEHHVGDIPFPVKLDNPSLKDVMNKLESEAASRMLVEWSMQPVHALQEADARVVKICELIEMAEWGAEEWLMGNKFAALVMGRCWDAANEMSKLTSPFIQKRIDAYLEKRHELIHAAMRGE